MIRNYFIRLDSLVNLVPQFFLQARYVASYTFGMDAIILIVLGGIILTNKLTKGEKLIRTPLPPVRI